MQPPGVESPETPLVSIQSDYTMPPSVDSFNMEPVRRNSSPELRSADLNAVMKGALNMFHGGQSKGQPVFKVKGGKLCEFEFSGSKVAAARKESVWPYLWHTQFSTVPEEDGTSTPVTPDDFQTEKEPRSHPLFFISEDNMPSEEDTQDGKQEMKPIHRRSSSHPELSFLAEHSMKTTLAPVQRPLHVRSGSPNLGLLAPLRTPEAEPKEDLYTTYRKSRSVPASPHISPRLARKTMEDMKIQIPADKTLLIANLTGVLRNIKKQQKMSPAEAANSAPPACAPPPPVATEIVDTFKTPVHVEKKSVVSSFVSWATTSQVKQSKKEMNVFSPTSL